ncbi:MAG TPA: tetratricopeptide repeat protein [Bryobacteraceae bacterium]
MKACALLILLAASSAWTQTALNDAQALLASASAAAKAGQTETAIRQFRQILRGAPAREIAGQARLELVRIHMRRGDWWDAAEQLQELRKMAPQEAEYAYQLGVVYRNLSRSSLVRLQAVAPESARLQQMLGEQFSIAGNSSQAIAAFKQAVAADPKLAGSHLALAVIYHRLGKRDQALAEIDKELTLAPESAVARQVRDSIVGGLR